MFLLLLLMLFECWQFGVVEVDMKKKRLLLSLKSLLYASLLPSDKVSSAVKQGGMLNAEALGKSGGTRPTHHHRRWRQAFLLTSC